MASVIDTITIKRLVLVDSAGFCFIEIPIDRHAILLGKGNIGKSSLLNALRLFLLPENNFNKSQLKFAFREPKKNDYYSNNDSYRHYFPSTRSFLILESENEAGTHCQILYRTNNLGYGRLFTPLPFEKIRQFFWDVTGDDEGIGQAVARLSIANIKDSLKKLSPKTEIVSDTAKLRRTLYAEPNDLLDSDSSRYCLVPLHKVDDDNVESLRALILLLFEMDTSAESMAQALANIIESSKKTSDDILDFDIDAFLSKHDDLKQQRSDIVKLRDLQASFDNLARDHENYLKLSEADKGYIALTQSLSIQEEQAKKEALESTEQYSNAQQKNHDIKNDLGDINSDLIAERRSLKDTKARRRNQDEVIAKVKMLRSQYHDPNYSLDEIKADLQQDIEQNTDDLNALKSTEDNLILKNSLEKIINKSKLEIERIQQSLDNKEFQLLEQLPEQSSAILTAINKQLILANPHRKITEQERLGITSFTSLFEDRGDVIKWFDQDLLKDKVDIGENLQTKLSDEQANLTSYKKRYNNITVEKDAISQKKEIESLKKKIKASENDIVSIKKHPNSAHVEQEKNNSIQYEKTIKQLEAKEEKLNTTFEQSKSKLVELKETRDEKDKAVGEINQLKRSLARLGTRYARLKQLTIDDAKLEKVLTITEDDVDQLDSDLAEFDRLREHIKSELKDLHRREVITEPDLLAQ
ncbi:MAG: hypothetical protein PSN44_07295, partial [Gammaproteobacteria bacterium]|nr:hypothetical protein [Gammaproteobacteria bacterium]